jgi:hypothetical protein
MKPVSSTYNIYPNLGYWFLLFIALVFAGFYHTYFSVFTGIKDSIIHIHFVLMALWIAILITQPFLIKYKKLALHRMIGKISYVIVPLALVSQVLMIRFGYNAYTENLSRQLLNGVPQYSRDQILHMAAKSYALPFVYIVWMGLFYSLAIINRKNTPVHARYMIAVAMTVLGPTVDRIIFFLFKIEIFPFGIPVESFSFLLTDIILAWLLIRDYRKKRSTRIFRICLIIYVISHIWYFIVPDTTIWERLVTAILRPAI